LAVKIDLPNASGSTSNLTSEMSEYERLYKLKPRLQTTNISFTSTTSSTTYNTATYNSGAYANTGEQGMMLVLKDVLTSYLLVASDFNGKADQTSLDTTNTSLALLTLKQQGIVKINSMGGLI